MEKYLCFDIGYVKPGIVLIIKDLTDNTLNIEVFENIKFTSNLDSISILEYFFSQKINYVILEQQLTNKNISLMQFIHGYSIAKGIKVIIKRPFSCLREKDEKKTTRSLKKNFSIDYLNSVLLDNNLNKKYIAKDSDICDAINLGLLQIYSINKKNINTLDIKIKKITHLRFALVTQN